MADHRPHGIIFDELHAQKNRDLFESHVVAINLGRSVSIDNAAQLLGVSRRTIYNRIRDGRLQTIRTLGGSQRVLLESLRSEGQRHV